MDWRSQVYRPALVVRPDRVKKNFDRMQEKAAASGVVFRPHFKTHQSAFVGEWFKSRGLEQITVSSVRMALYFAGHGWKDITIAFPVNLREIEDIRDLAGRVRLNLLLLSKETAEELNGKLSEKVGIWIKVDVGYGRTGIPWNEEEKIVDLARTVKALPKLEFRGLLTHAGQTYHMHDRQERAELFVQITEGLNRLRERVLEAGITNCLLSVGDTPGTTAAADFRGVDEVRPGNFVYFDAQQWHLGSCEEGEIAAAVACPVVAVHQQRNEIVIYGGAVHLSAQAEPHPRHAGVNMYGYAVACTPDGWDRIDPDCYIRSVSQEHGVARVSAELLEGVKVGDLLCVIPVHSCLAVDLLDTAITTDFQLFSLDFS